MGKQRGLSKPLSQLFDVQSQDLSEALAQILLRYRTTPHSTTGKSPAEMMFGRNVRTRLDLLHPQLKKKTSRKGKGEVTDQKL